MKLNCNELSDKILESIKEEMKTLGRKPGLSVIQVGDNPASTTYVRKKREKSESLGFLHEQINYPNDVTEERLIEVIKELNEDDTVDGILVQLPLPKHIDENKVIDAIDPNKDVDGFSPINVGRLMLGQECFIPCTPKGILDVISHFNVPTEGKNVVVFGRSNIVGRPMANLLSQKPWNSNVTLLHSNTSEEDKRRYLADADIIVLAVGKPKFLTKDIVDTLKENVTIIDVGINRIEDATKKSGFRLVGDLDTTDIREDINYTPVPGGVGIMTTTELMMNTLEAYKRKE